MRAFAPPRSDLHRRRPSCTVDQPAGPRRRPAADPDIQTVITTQIDAFGRDDAAQAESFASEGIKSKFPDASSFLGMVKQSYPALVRPRSTHFEPTMTSDSGTVQKVTVVDANGGVWTAVYTLEKVDGHWVISGCALLKTPETSA